MGDRYLPWFAEWASGSRWHAKMGLLYVLSATGVFGLLVFISFFIAGLRQAQRTINYPMGRFYVITTQLFTVLYLMRQTEISFIVLGLLFAFCVNGSTADKMNVARRSTAIWLGNVRIGFKRLSESLN